MVMERDRVISVTLSEADWQAFIARQPQPVDWLRERIRQEVERPAQQVGTKPPVAPAHPTAA